MKSHSLTVVFGLAALLPSRCADVSTTLLPGLTYYEGDERLSGCVLFLHNQVPAAEKKPETAGSIYEFNFSKKNLRKITTSPGGLFVVSDEGDPICVIHSLGGPGIGRDTNVFVYSESLGLSRVVHLESSPRDTVAMPGHIFFQMEGYGGFNAEGFYTTKNKGISFESKIVGYDIANDQLRDVELSGATTWQYEHYDRMHRPKGPTNVLHFYYDVFGKRVRDGKHYQNGFYSLDVSTGNIQWFAELLDDKDDTRHTYKAFDGRYIFFEGDSAPITGYKLVSSPWDFRETKRRDPKGDRVTVLKSFSRLSVVAAGGGAYLLAQMSPDGRYALVRLQERTSPKVMAQPGWMNTYYLVDVSNGKTRIFLKDEVEQKTNGSISPVRWVGAKN